MNAFCTAELVGNTASEYKTILKIQHKHVKTTTIWKLDCLHVTGLVKSSYLAGANADEDIK